MAIKFSNTFLLRKLHQLTGIVPLGLFYFAHLFTNSKAMNGESAFEKGVEDIHGIPFLLLIEIFGIFLPLLYHSIYGILISGEAKPNVLVYKYQRNWFYLFQRITGIFLFVFILFHLLNLRFGLIPGLNEIPVAGHASQAYNIVAGEFAMMWVVVIYVLGVAATAWHLGYGIWLFMVDWGLVVGEKAQKYTLYACILIAITLFGVGVNAIWSFRRACGIMPQAICESSGHSAQNIAPNLTFTGTR